MIELYRRLPLWSQVTWWALLLAVLGRVAFAKPSSASVVPIYLKAGERWRAGENLYAPAAPLDVFRYPPPIAAFFAPFSMLPDKTAAIVWRLLNITVYLVALRELVRQFEQHSPLSRLQLGLFAFFSALLVLVSFNNGQVNVLLAAGFLLAWVNLERDHLGLAAIAISLTALVKVYPLALGLLFGVVVPRFLLRLGIVMLSLSLAYLLLVPDYSTQMLGEFLAFLDLDAAYRLLHHRIEWDWTLIVEIAFGGRIEDGVRKLVSVVAGVAFAAIIFLHRREPTALLAAWSLGCGWMTLFGPATENATYSILAPVAAMFFLRAHTRRDWLTAWLICSLLAVPIVRGMFPKSGACPTRAAMPLGAALLILETIRQFRRSPDTHEAHGVTHARTD